jgi:hypothetical protein
MSVQHDPNSPINESVTFEPTDVATRPIAVSVALLAVFTLVFTAAGHLVYFGLAERERASSPEPSPLAEQYAAKAPPEPRLQIHPKTDLEALHASEDKTLYGWGWEDKEKGTAHVPIERAMQLLVAKNLPARGGAVPWKMAPRGNAPQQHPEGSGAPDWQPGYFYVGEGHEAAASAHGEAAHGEAAHGEAAHGEAAHGEKNAAPAHSEKAPSHTAPAHGEAGGHGH